MDDRQVEQIERALRRISEMIKQKGRELLTELPITSPQVIALHWLNEHGEMTIGELSAKMYLACSTTTDLIARMEKNDLVLRVRDGVDRRVVRIQLLQRGRMVIEEVIKRRQAYLQHILSDYTQKEVDLLEACLATLHDKMETT